MTTEERAFRKVVRWLRTYEPEVAQRMLSAFQRETLTEATARIIHRLTPPGET